MRFALIGHPVAHSQSPALFAAAYGGRWEYDLVDAMDFDEAWDAFQARYQAVNVTAPFKKEAAARAGLPSAEVIRTGAANILVKSPEGVRAYNSDYLGLRAIMRGLDLNLGTAAVIGLGGAGLAAAAAAEDEGLSVSRYHHDGISGGVSADIIFYTLPAAVPGIGLLDCKVLVEANYKDPCLTGTQGCIYISGFQWLEAQARCGFSLMTGERPLGF